MANEDYPNGARPIGTMNGSEWQASVRAYECDAATANIFPGDFVILEADGFVAAAPAGTAAGAELIGVCVGVLEHYPQPISGVNDSFMSTGSLDYLKYHATGATGYILVSVGPDILYEIQNAGQGAMADVGKNADIVATVGNTQRGISQQELNATAAAASAQLRIVQPVNRVDNDVTAVNSRWIVRINESHFTKLVGI